MLIHASFLVAVITTNLAALYVKFPVTSLTTKGLARPANTSFKASYVNGKSTQFGQGMSLQQPPTKSKSSRTTIRQDRRQYALRIKQPIVKLRHQLVSWRHRSP